MTKKSITKLEPRELEDVPVGFESVKVRLPFRFKRRIDKLNKKYGSYKKVVETALNMYLENHQKSKQKIIHKWEFTTQINNNIMKEINDRMDFDFTTKNNAVIIALTEMLSKLGV